MKTLATLILILSSTLAFAAENNSCLNSVTAIANANLEALIAKNNLTLDYPEMEVHAVPHEQGSDPNETYYYSILRLSDLHDYDYSFTYTAAFLGKTSGACVEEYSDLSLKLTDIQPPQDQQEDGTACFNEVGLLCETGFVDRCERFPKAGGNHACVPDVKD